MRSSEQVRVFQLVAGHPALDLVNTLDWRFRGDGSEELLKSYGDLLHFAEQTGLLATQQMRRLLREANEAKAGRILCAAHELREAAADVFYSALDECRSSGTSIERLEAQFKNARAHQTLVAGEAGLKWEWPATTLELPLWQLSLATEELMTSETFHMLQACAKPDCRWLFLDTSKNHTRRWCDMKVCGNRMKARRFKEQHRMELGARSRRLVQ